MTEQKGFGIDEKRTGILPYIGKGIKKAAKYTIMTGFIFAVGAASEYMIHNELQARINSYKGIPGHQGPGDRIEFVYNQESNTFSKYLETPAGRAELADDNLPINNNMILDSLYKRGPSDGINKEFFIIASQRAQGDYPKDFVVGMTRQGLIKYHDEFSMADTVPAAWRSFLNEGSDALKCLDNILE